jgi:hypothetical protein
LVVGQLGDFGTDPSHFWAGSSMFSRLLLLVLEAEDHSCYCCLQSKMTLSRAFRRQRNEFLVESRWMRWRRWLALANGRVAALDDSTKNVQKRRQESGRHHHDPFGPWPDLERTHHAKTGWHQLVPEHPSSNLVVVVVDELRRRQGLEERQVGVPLLLPSGIEVAVVGCVFRQRSFCLLQSWLGKDP